MKTVFLLLILFVKGSFAHLLPGDFDHDGYYRPINYKCIEITNKTICEAYSGCLWASELDPSCRNHGYYPPSGRCETQKKNVTCFNWDACEWVECLNIRRCVAKPTPEPTDSPSMSPTSRPTQSPSPNPTINPTMSPTPRPTKPTTSTPTTSPTFPIPTISPSKKPTSGSPTTSPSISPTSGSPTISPTAKPTFEVQPDNRPSTAFKIYAGTFTVALTILYVINNPHVDFE